MEFGTYKSFYHYQTRSERPLFPHISSKLKPDEFYKRLLREFARAEKSKGPPPPFLMAYVEADIAWYKSGEPEYRVWPDAAMALGYTDIDIDCTHLRLPWPALVITFPRWLVCTEKGYEIESILITEVMEPAITRQNVLGKRADGTVVVHPDAPRDQRKLLMLINLGTKDEDALYWKLPLKPGTSIRQEFEGYFCAEKSGIGREQALWLLSIAVCTCFFSVGRSTQSRLLVPAFERPRGGNLRRIYEVGRELVLPVYDDTGPRSESREGEGTGRSPRSHFRRGHLRWQPYGPRDNPHYELIFIPPTIVQGEGVPSRVEPVSIKLHA